MAIKLHPSLAVHPGRWLRAEIVEAHELSVTEAARHLGVTRPATGNLLNGKAALSPEMAIRFEKGFGIPAATMLRMQAAHELRADEIKVGRSAGAVRRHSRRHQEMDRRSACRQSIS